MGRSRKDGPSDYDVTVCYLEPSGADLAALVSEGLTRRGFRVFDCRRQATGVMADDPTLQVIEDTPDFVLIATHEALAAADDEGDPWRKVVARALDTERNVVVMRAPSPAGSAPSESPLLAALARRPTVRYEPSRSQESVARVSHMLSSQVEVRDRDDMRGFKRLTTVAAVILLAVVSVVVARAVSRLMAPKLDVRPLPPLVLYSAVFGQASDGNTWRELGVQDGGQVSGRDQLRVVFAASADGYGYVVSRDPLGEITVLFPARTIRPDARIRAGQMYDAPVDTDWATVGDAPGQTTVYVIASYDPVENIESLIEEHPEESNGEARQALLESAIGGLLDGRHAIASSTVRTRRGRPIVGSLEAPRQTLSAAVKLGSGAVVTRQLVAQPGLQSAVSELRLHAVPR